MELKKFADTYQVPRGTGTTGTRDLLPAEMAVEMETEASVNQQLLNWRELLASWQPPQTTTPMGITTTGTFKYILLLVQLIFSKTPVLTAISKLALTSLIYLNLHKKIPHN